MAWIALLALCMAERPAAGQARADTTAQLVGTVRSSVTWLPIPSVMVAVRGARTFGVTDAAGAFLLAGLPPGRQTVRILYGDNFSYEHAITLQRGKTLKLVVLLDVDAVALSPIVVEVKGLGAERTLAGFYERRKRGFGRYYSPADLAGRGAERLTTLLGEAGVNVRCGQGSCAPMLFAGDTCVMATLLDGMWVPFGVIAFLRLDALAAVEVYRHAIDVPTEFQFGFGYLGASSCGAILLWSRP